jgi:uncharacterized protein YjeT (DUF2065 family)
MSDFLVAVGLLLAIEGSLYALAPAAMKRMVRSVLEIPDQTLRTAGLAAVAAGVLFVWLIRG